MAKTNPAELFMGQMKEALNSFNGYKDDDNNNQVVKTSRPQENKSPRDQEGDITREQDFKNTRDKEDKNSRGQEMRADIKNPISSEKATDVKNVTRRRKPKKNVDNSRLVESDGIRRFPVNLTMREDYHIALKVLAAQRQVQMWTLLDEAIGRYLSSEK